MKRHIWFLIALTVLHLARPSNVGADGFWSKFIDKEDHALDLSEWLLEDHGFLPVPLILTEPAIGVGFGFALAFFHDFNTPKEYRGTDEAAEYADMPPSVSALAGAYTSNDSWLAGGGHVGSYKQDRIRYTGAVGLASVNLSFYVDDTAFDYNIEAGFLYQEIKFRLGQSNWFFGGNYMYAPTESAFDLGLDIPGLDPLQFDSNNAGVGLLIFFDNQNSFFTPDQGIEAELELARFDTAVGGDFDYNEVELDFQSFHSMGESFVLGFRLVGSTTDGDVPFYGLPFVKLRGVPAMRYQDDTAGSIEIEGRWDVSPRWSLLAFAGAGTTEGDVPEFDTEESIYAGGVGFRYLIAKVIGLRSGIDVAQGPEETVVYIQFGHAW